MCLAFRAGKGLLGGPVRNLGATRTQRIREIMASRSTRSSARLKHKRLGI